MKKFKFTLEKVLSFKQQSLDILINELSRLQNQMEILQTDIDKLHNIMKDTNCELVKRLKEGIETSKVSMYKIYLNDVHVHIKKLLEEQRALQNKIELKQQEIIEMKSSIAGLEKLKDKQLFDYNQMLKKVQEQEISEFVSRNLTA